ncbi:hypothetical protein ACFV9E_01730 [Streptomyces sp. NPDC059835]|uniref:hypothetical protein n=1 Tax=Streptomyces sp. NPDC059835 TaxID=3346967 RepID=UPI00364E75E8
MDEVPSSVAAYAHDGYSTVIRLPLRSPEARQEVVQQLQALNDRSAPPFELFLDRLETVSLAYGTGPSETRAEYSRKTTELLNHKGLQIQEIHLSRGPRLLIATSRVDEATVARTIAAGRAERTMGTAWESWSGDASVSIAVSLDETITTSRMYTFLPMGAAAKAPFGGYLNAPFSAGLDRRTLNREMPWNSMLLDRAADTCASVAQLAAADRLPLPDGTLLDLVSWYVNDVPRLSEAFARMGADIDTVPFVPVLRSAPGRTSLERARLWKPPAQCTRFTPLAVALTGVPDIVDHYAIGSQRLKRLEHLAAHRKRDLRPTAPTLAAWAERCAASLAAQGLPPRAWTEFYSDLSRNVSAELCAGRSLLMGHEGVLVPPSSDGRQVFFAPEPDRDGTMDVALPPGLEQQVVFLRPDIPLSVTGTRHPTEAKRWLEENGLVRSYSTETVLELIAAAMASAGGDEEQLRACLAGAFRTWNGSVLDAAGTAITAKLLVPTAGGWSHSSRAVFSNGWTDPAGSEIDAVLTRFLNRDDAQCTSLDDVRRRLLRSPADVVPDVPVHRLYRFLELCGVRHGLPLEPVPHTNVRVLGSNLARPSSTPWEPGWGVSSEEFRQWIHSIDNLWARGKPVPSASYTCENVFYQLPGREAFETFDDTSRSMYAELVLHGLRRWPKSSVVFRGANGTAVEWPSPVAGFLSTTAWFPQTTPGNRSAVAFRRPEDAWFVPAQDRVPDFLAAQPSGVNLHLDDHVQLRLGALGVRMWKDPSSATDRLRHLVELLRDAPSVRHIRSMPGIRAAYEAAWADLLPSGRAEAPPAGPFHLDVLVQRSGVLSVLPADGHESIYVLDSQGASQYGLLKQTQAALLPLRRAGLATRVREYLARRGATALRLASGTDIELTIDGEPFHRAPRHALLETVSPWLPVAVAGLLELHPQPGPRLRFADVMDKLGEATFTLARHVQPVIEGHPASVPDRPHALLHQGPAGPLIVSVPGTAHNSPAEAMWAALQAASTAIVGLLGVPGLDDSLRLHLIDLERRCPDPTSVAVEAIAGVLDLDVAELLELTPGYALIESTVQRLLPLLVCVDAAAAALLVVEGPSLCGVADLKAWLASRLAGTDTGAGLLLSLADSDDRRAALAALEISLQQANTLWRAHGYPPLHDADGHARQLEAWLQRNRAVLCDQIRDAFLSDYTTSGDSLDYMESCAALSVIGPDPAWLDMYWELPDDLLQAHLDTWLGSRAPVAPAPVSGLPPVAELRRLNRENIRRWLADPPAHFPSHDLDPAPAPGHRRPTAAQALRALSAHGLLDFEELTPQATALLLRRLGLWTVEDLTAERRSSGASTSTSDLAAGSEGSAGVRSAALTPAVADTLPTFAEDFARRLGPIRTTAGLTTAPPVTAAPRSGGPRRYAATGADHDAMSAQHIGLAGEMVAGEWLRQKFGVPLEESWVSGFRAAVLGDDRGDDSLGYDFVITTADTRHYFEVKASEGDGYEFELGATQVRRARRLAKDETYSVLYISHVRDEEARLLTHLPNPFSPQGLPLYQVTAETCRLRFFPSEPNGRLDQPVDPVEGRD